MTACPYGDPKHYEEEGCMSCEQYKAYPALEERERWGVEATQLRQWIGRQFQERIHEAKRSSPNRFEVLEGLVGAHGVEALTRLAESNDAMELYWEEDEVIHILYEAGMITLSEWSEVIVDSVRPT
jgi:hypothetical protein